MDQNKIDYKLLGRILRLAMPYRKILILATSLTVVLAPLAVLRPYLIQRMVDDFIFKYDLNGLGMMALIFFCVLLVEVGMTYLFIYSSKFKRNLC